MTIKIKYTGSAGIRRLDEYEWNAGNGYEQSVDVETAANLITYPRPGQFQIVAQKISRSNARKLARLTGLTEKEVHQLASEGPSAWQPALTDLPGLVSTRANEFRALGVDSVATLAQLDQAGIRALATRSGAGRGEIANWVQAARQMPGMAAERASVVAVVAADAADQPDESSPAADTETPDQPDLSE